MTDERAISDALGFILVFAIIISTVAVVYVGGFNSLDNARQYERMNNAERAFEVFADNVEDITQRGAPSRATEIKLSEASLEAGQTREIEVNVTREGTPSKNLSNVVQYQPVVYESQTDRSNRMVYDLGATFRASSGGTTMSTEPQWILTESRVIIPLVQTVSTGTTSIAGSETVLVRTTSAGSDVLVENTTAQSHVYINVTSPRADAWESYMSDNEAVDCRRLATNEVSCEMEDVDIVYVTNHQINYEFD